MLRFAQTRRLEMAYARMAKEFSPGEWTTLGGDLPVATRLQQGNVPHSTAFFRSYLRLFEFDLNAWRYNLTVDKHIWMRMSLAGVRMGFLDQTMVTSPLRPQTTHAHELAEDRD